VLRRTRALTPFIALACLAGLLFPVAAQAANGVCLGRKHTSAGTAAGDPLPGGDLADVLAGLDGDDAISGAGGDDRLCGGAGDDFVSGDGGADLLRGNAGDDILVGGAGADRYNGGPGTDICDFGPGDRSSGGCEMSFEDDADGDGLTNGAELLAKSNLFAADSEEVVAETVEELSDEGVVEIDSDNTQAAVTDCTESGGTPDLDRDGVRDECDEDLDGDMIANNVDLCPTRMHGDPNYGGCPPLVPGDRDTDGVVDYPDNCPDDWNPEQTDTDGDGAGDVCDANLPTFFEFYEALAAIFGPCPLGPVLCELTVLLFYDAIFGEPPPPYTLPPGYFGAGAPCPIIIICGIGGIGGIGIGIGII
jgi:hypothetical protein